MAHDVNNNYNNYHHEIPDGAEIRSAEFYRNAMYIKIQKRIQEAIDGDKHVVEIFLGQSKIGTGLTKYLEDKGFTIRISKYSDISYYYLQL